MDFDLKWEKTRNGKLCDSCCYSHIITRGTQKIYLCNKNDMHSIIMTGGPVEQCNQYYPEDLPSLFDLEKLAWELKTDNRKVVGFTPPKKKEE